MPVKIPDALPATRTLMEENIFVMTEHRAQEQDIRPLHIGILNLMPMKIATETQLLRLLGNTPLQVEVTLLKTASYESSNTSREHLATFYRTFDEVKDELFDGLIITGAPVEQMPFEDVDYWEELTRIMAWSRKHVFSTLFICWASQAGLYYHHGIPKYPVPEKIFGVFEHVGLDKQCKLLRGFDDVFEAPQSRHTEVRREDIERCPELKILAESDEAGILLLASQDGREVYIAGHLEYDANTLELEYQRDLAKGMKMGVPRHYYPADDPSKLPRVTWRAHANLLFANWLNYYVYQETPYDLGKIG